MHQSARQAAILRTLGMSGTSRVAELAEALEVSDETIRRDIKVMANKGLVERVHGGAVLPGLFREPDFQKRLNHNAEAKKAIARIAAQQIKDSESLMLDTGSSTAYVARALTSHSDLMVVTNCTEIARTLAASNRNQVYLAGGELRADDGAVFGSSAINFVRQFRVQAAILSIGAINFEDGLMDYHLSEADFSRAVMAQANYVIVVADQSKLGAQAPVKVCDLADIDMLITDQSPPLAYTEQLAQANVTLLVAGPVAEKAAN